MLQFLVEVSCAGISKKYQNTNLGSAFSLSDNYTIKLAAIQEFIFTIVGPWVAGTGNVSLGNLRCVHNLCL